MRASMTLISGLAAITTAAAQDSWSYDPSAGYTSTSSSEYYPTTTGYDTAWGSWSSSTTAYPVSTDSYDPSSWGSWASSTTAYPVTTGSYDPSTWGSWASSTTAYPVTTGSYDPSTWGAWPSGSTVCPPWTGGTAAPAYYTNLPDSVKSALPSWTGAPPSDYCLYTSWMQSYASCTSPVAAYPTTTLATSYPVGAQPTSAYGTYSGSSPVAPVATFTGAANANAVSFAVAGLAAAAAMVVA